MAVGYAGTSAAVTTALVPFIPTFPTLAAKAGLVGITAVGGAITGTAIKGGEKIGDWMSGRAKEQERAKQRDFEASIGEAVGLIRGRMLEAQPATEALVQEELPASRERKEPSRASRRREEPNAR